MNIFKYVCTFFVRLPEGKNPLFGISGWLDWLCLLAPLVVVSFFFFSFHDCAVKDEKQQKKKLSQKMCAVCSVFHFFFFFLAFCHPLACTSFYIPSSRSPISNLLLARLISSRGVGWWRPRSSPSSTAVAFFVFF